MFQVFRLLSLRYVLKKWDRAALIVASIALGVATLVSTRILNQVIQEAAANTTTPLGMGDVFISNGEIGIDRKMAEEIRAAKIPGIESVQPVVVDRVYLPEQNNRASVLLGVELATHQLPPGTNLVDLFEKKKLSATLNEGNNALKAKFSEADLSSSTLLYAYSRRMVVLSRTLYDDWVKLRKSETDPFLLRYGSRTIECLPIFVVDYGEDSPLYALGPNLVGMDIEHAASFVRPEAPRVNRIDVLFQPGTNAEEVANRIKEFVGQRATVRTAKEQGSSTQEVVGGIQIGFTMCSIGAMVVGLFLVYNALAVTVAERRHDIGIIRSIGSTRLQVVGVFIGAALVLGVFGAICGVPLGIGMAKFALNLIKDDLASMFTAQGPPSSWPTWGTVWLASASGVATAVLASLIPSVQAASQDPADVVRRVPGGPSGRWLLAHRLTCLFLVAGGVAMILGRTYLPARIGAFGGMVMALVGMLLSAPIFVAMTVRVLQPILKYVLSIEARLAADNLLRSPGRTGLVIGALGAGVAVMIQTAGVGKSNEEPVKAWLDEVIQAEQFISTGSVTEAITSMSPADGTLVDEVIKLPGVESAAGIRYVRPEYNGTRIFLTAIDMDRFILPSQRRGTDGLPGLTAFGALPRSGNGVIMSDNFAYRQKVAIGDTINVQGPAGPVELKVLGTVKDYSWSRGTLFMDRGVFGKLFLDTKVDIVHVFLNRESEQATQDARKSLATFAADRGFIVADRVALRKMVGDLIERIYKLVHLQQIVVGFVAALGVVTSLLISVLQRKRELGLLLAVGATPGQVVRTVLAEAILMGVLGTVLGFLIGIPLEWYVLKVVLFEESGFHFDLLLPWQQAIGISLGAIVVATLAGLFPALQSIKTRIPDAIAYE